MRRIWHWCKGLRQADIRLKAEYTVSDLVGLWTKQEGKCAVTGIALIAGETASIDHIIPVADGREGLGCITNMRFVHTVVNRMKWDLSEEDFKTAILGICPQMIEWAKK